jgi:hypothetical protein
MVLQCIKVSVDAYSKGQFSGEYVSFIVPLFSLNLSVILLVVTNYGAGSLLKS